MVTKRIVLKGDINRIVQDEGSPGAAPHLRINFRCRNKKGQVKVPVAFWDRVTMTFTATEASIRASNPSLLKKLKQKTTRSKKRR